MDKKNFKVIILCGGLGSRLSAETKKFLNPWLKLENYQY